jgi:hypothetical protein
MDPRLSPGGRAVVDSSALITTRIGSVFYVCQVFRFFVDLLCVSLRSMTRSVSDSSSALVSANVCTSSSDSRGVVLSWGL